MPFSSPRLPVVRSGAKKWRPCHRIAARERLKEVWQVVVEVFVARIADSECPRKATCFENRARSSIEFCAKHTRKTCGMVLTGATGPNAGKQCQIRWSFSFQ
eukprot:2563759-Amphidinium_carterae.1